MTPTPPDWSSLLPALLDFERSPGRYAVLLREPRPLFEQTLTVLQLAAGRSVDGLADLAQDPAQTDELKRAARFFVRTVLLRPGVDHYTLLGLAPGCEAAELREHYRLMIRLTHPDFAAGGGEAWPADAATRINQANDVLSSFERRTDYNATLAPAGVAGSAASGSASAGGSAGFGAAAAGAAPGGFGSAGAGAASAGAGHAVLAPRAGLAPKRLKKDAAGEGWRVPRGAKIALASLGALAAAAALVMGNPGSDSGSLTVRKQPSVANPTLQAETGLTLVGDAAREAQVETVQAVRTEPHSVRTEPVEVLTQRKASFDKLRTNGNTGSAQTNTGSARTGKNAFQGNSVSGAETTATAATQQADGGSETALSLMMDTRMAAPVAMPVSMAVAATPVAPVKAAAALASPAAPAEAPPTLAQVQPALSNLMGSLPGARGENMAHWIDADFRAHPDTGRFVSRFNQLLAGQRVTQLGEVRFSSRTQGAQLVVDGVIKLHTLDTAEQARVRDLHLRAFFQPHEGRTVLTQLVAGPLQ